MCSIYTYKTPHHDNKQPSDNVSEVGGGMTRGKVTREILERIFGPMLLKAVEGHKQREQQLAASTRGPGEAKAHEEEDAIVDTLAGTDSVAGRLQASWFDGCMHGK